MQNFFLSKYPLALESVPLLLMWLPSYNIFSLSLTIFKNISSIICSPDFFFIASQITKNCLNKKKEKTFFFCFINSGDFIFLIHFSLYDRLFYSYAPLQQTIKILLIIISTISQIDVCANCHAEFLINRLNSAIPLSIFNLAQVQKKPMAFLQEKLDHLCKNGKLSIQTDIYGFWFKNKFFWRFFFPRSKNTWSSDFAVSLAGGLFLVRTSGTQTLPN